MNREKRDLRMSISITREFKKLLKEKSEEYKIDESTLASLFEFIGYFSLIKVEQQIDSIGGKYDTKEIIGRLANNQDISPYHWNWSVRELLHPAIIQLETEQVLINGLESLRRLSKQRNKKIIITELSKINYKEVKNEIE